MYKYHEECGVFGIWSGTGSASADQVAVGLTALQHRGQEAAGIAVNDQRVIRYHKGLGLVHEVFDHDELTRLGSGRIAVGHVRYSTSGNNTVINAQPMVVRHVKGQLALCHNGNLINSDELRRTLELEGCIFQTTSDTEVISYLITRARLKAPSIEEAVRAAVRQLQGSFSLVMMSPAKLLACRDRFGLRPLCLGEMPDGSPVFASESCALDAVGARLIRELNPGELVVVDDDGMRSIPCFSDHRQHALCVFEYIYFSRPDSVVQGISVHEARARAGAFLAADHPVDADLVIGVPDSGLDAALGYAEAAGIPYGIGLVKNKYIGRTFIAPTQKERADQVRLKLNAVSSVVSGKRIILIDDSIVRGTTSKYIVQLLKDAGASEVHLRISAPPFLHPCFYGTDIDSDHSLIANGHTPEEIARMIGADSLAFLSLDRVYALAGEELSGHLCAACFDGNYPAGVPTVADKDRFEIS
ncbi:MAG: amidophosphoribosyltransferase [Lachnospiraceae bacterium]|nr:amidophosphoribosyltransferase [Lachnospiraceae bacterium]